MVIFLTMCFMSFSLVRLLCSHYIIFIDKIQPHSPHKILFCRSNCNPLPRKDLGRRGQPTGSRGCPHGRHAEGVPVGGERHSEGGVFQSRELPCSPPPITPGGADEINRHWVKCPLLNHKRPYHSFFQFQASDAFYGQRLKKQYVR